MCLFLGNTIIFHGMNINVHDNLIANSDDEEENDDDQEKNDCVDTPSRNPSRETQKPESCKLSYDFWDRAFPENTEVTWVDFKKKFEMEYKDKTIKRYTEEEFKLFVNLIYKDIFMLNKSMKRATYDQFCEGNPDADPHRFYHRLGQYAKGYHAMREVFNMDSTLRLITIQKLGQSG